jgi:hypothetical protein
MTGGFLSLTIRCLRMRSWDFLDGSSGKSSGSQQRPRQPEHRYSLRSIEYFFSRTTVKLLGNDLARRMKLPAV